MVRTPQKQHTFLNIDNKMMHQIFSSFLKDILRNGQNWAKKLIFWLNLRVFLFTPYEIHSKILPIKSLIKIYICVKFHQYSICGCEIKNFQSILYWFSINELAPFWDLLGTCSRKYCLILLKLPELASNKKNTVFEKSYKILNVGSNGM